MGFWIFMLCTNLLIPLIMVLFGLYFVKKAPKNINYIFGYRTDMSMKNKDTWSFAHKYCGKLWLIIGIPLLVLTLVATLLVIGKSKDTVGNVSLIICMLQLVCLIVPIIPTEKALRRNFDKNGNRKEREDL